MNKSVVIIIVFVIFMSGCSSRKDQKNTESSMKSTDLEDQQSVDTLVSNIPASALGEPISLEELANHPLNKELARRNKAMIEGIRFKFEYDNYFGNDGVASQGYAYIGEKLIAEGKAKKYEGKDPTTIKVEIKHYSGKGEVIYEGTTNFLTHPMMSENGLILPGVPINHTDIKGQKKQIIFNYWPCE